MYWILFGFSFINSFIYWILSNIPNYPQSFAAYIDPYKIKTKSYIENRWFFKLLAIALLIPGSKVSYFVLIFYCCGDYILTAKETELAIFFFSLGHAVLIWTSMPLGTLTQFLPFTLVGATSFYFTSKYFPPDVPYKIYNVILHFLLYYAFVTENYYVICFIASDILIGIGRLHLLTWPLYYYSVLRMSTLSY